MLQRTSASSYFPYSRESHGEHLDEECVNERRSFQSSSRDQREESPTIDRLPSSLQGGVMFPKIDSILWDRTPCTAPIDLLAKDIVPPVVLDRGDVAELLSKLEHPTSLSPTSPGAPAAAAVVRELTFAVTPVTCLDSQLQRTLSVSSPSAPQFALTLVTNSRAHMVNPLFSLTVPIHSLDNASTGLSFEPPSTAALQQGLSKSLQSGRSFSLKNFLRVRGIGNARRSTSTILRSPLRSSSGPVTAVQQTRSSGMLRLESTVPELSFQCVGIRAIPILSTPLALSLLVAKDKQSESNSFFELSESRKPIHGFLSLSQTRKLVMISESDHLALSTMSVVGTWLRLSQADLPWLQSGISLQSILSHPICWAACARFLFNELIVNRVFVATNTFLLMLLVDDTVQCLEVSVLPTDSSSLQFLMLDYMAELSVDSSADDSSPLDPLESIVCRFKSMGRPNRQDFKLSSGQGSAKTVTATTHQKDIVGSSSSSSKEATVEHAIQLADEMEVPRVAPSPLNPPVRPADIRISATDSVPGGTYTSLNAAERDEAQSKLSIEQEIQLAQREGLRQAQATIHNHSAVTLPAHVLGIDVGELQYSFPAHIVAAQQRQITALQREVEHLRDIVRDLTTYLPLSSQAVLAENSRNRQSLEVNHSPEVQGPLLQHDEEKAIPIDINTEVNLNQEIECDGLAETISIVSVKTQPVPELVVSQPAPVIRPLNVDGDAARFSSEPPGEGAIDNMYIATDDDRQEVVDRIIPNVRELTLDTLILSERVPELLVRLSTESPLQLPRPTEEDVQGQTQEAQVEEDSIILSPVRTRTVAKTSPQSFRSMRYQNHSRARYTHHLPSQSTAVRFAEEEPSTVFESESILAIQTKYLSTR